MLTYSSDLTPRMVTDLCEVARVGGLGDDQKSWARLRYRYLIDHQFLPMVAMAARHIGEWHFRSFKDGPALTLNGLQDRRELEKSNEYFLSFQHPL